MALFTTPGASLGGIPGSAALARLLVVISGNSQGLTSALGQATGSLSGFQQNANALGNTMTRTVTLPILAIGGAIVKVAGDFEAAMARVAGLTTLASGKVEEFREKILELSASEDVIAGPKELADSLFIAGSAGLTAAQAFEVTELSAKGASIGMGSAADISRVLISLLNGFSGQAVTAAEAMDALTAAVKVGSAEPNELAISLGRLIPIASKIGLSMQEMVAQVSALTNIGVPTRVATTALRALFGQFLAPTIKAKENLEQLNISYEELQSAVKSGPLVAFELLNTAAEGNDQIIRNLIPQIRGLTAFFGLSGDKAKDTARALNLVRNSSGSLDKALDEFKGTPFFKFQNAINDLQVGAINMGSTVIPIFNQLVSVIADLGEGLQAIPDPMKGVLVGFLAFVAAAGPALKIFAALQSTSGVFLGSIASMAKGFGILAISATLAAGALSGISSGQGSIISFSLGLVAAFTSIVIVLGFVRRAVLATRLDSFISALLASMSGAQMAAISGGLTALVGAFILIARAQGKVTRETKKFGETLRDAASGNQTFQQFFKELRETVDSDIAERLIEIAKAAGLFGKIPVREGFTTFIASIGDELENALNKLDEFGFVANDNLSKAVPVLIKATNEGRDLGAALKEAGLSSEDFFFALEQFRTSGATGETDVLAANIEEIAKAYGQATSAQKQFIVDQAASIRAVGLNEEATQALADEYGTSYGFMQDKLSEFGVSAGDLAEDNKQIFLQEAGLVEATTGRIVGARAEAAAAEAEVVASRAESLSSAIDFFGKIDDLAKASSEKLVAASEKEATAFINFARNTRTLLKRGLDPAALQALVDEGPVMVGKFVNATDKQLKRYETNFAIAMAAGDAIAVNEGKHLEKKGDANIAGFTEAMLGNKNLTVQAMQEIMTAMRSAIISGDLKPEALPLIQGFADALSKNKNIPRDKVGSIVTALIRKIGDKPKFAKAGADAIVAWATGMGEKLGLTKEQTRLVVTAFISELDRGKRKAYLEGQGAVRTYAQGARQQTGLAQSAGVDVGNKFKEGLGVVGSLYALGQSVAGSFIAGIASMQGPASVAAEGLADAVRGGVNQQLHNSPKLFTYYLGQDLVTQLYDGMKQKGNFKRPVVLAGATANTGVASMDRLANAMGQRDRQENRFKRHRPAQVKLDSYLVGRAERMNYLRKADRV